MQGALPHAIYRVYARAGSDRRGRRRPSESEGRRIYEVVGHASWIHSPRWLELPGPPRFPPCYRRLVIRVSLIACRKSNCSAGLIGTKFLARRQGGLGYTRNMTTHSERFAKMSSNRRAGRTRRRVAVGNYAPR